jgi:hypothetical protein
VKDPYIKVTYLGRGWGVRCYTPDGKHFTEEHARTKEMIGVVARSLLRFCDKGCGPCEATKYTDRARHRAWGKARLCSNEHDTYLKNLDMSVGRFNNVLEEQH